MPAAATTGRAGGPRPASSTPATRRNPRAHASHSKRSLGSSDTRLRRPQTPALTVAGSVATAGASGLGLPSVRYSRSEEHTSELQSRLHLVCRLLLEKKKKKTHTT